MRRPNCIRVVFPFNLLTEYLQIALLSCSSSSSCHPPHASTCTKCSGPLVHDHYSEAVRSKVTERRADADRKRAKKTSKRVMEVAAARKRIPEETSFRGETCHTIYQTFNG
jgi:hypothetical protein